MSENKNAVSKPNKNEDKKNTNAKSMAPVVNEKIKYYILLIALFLVVAVIFIVLNEAHHENKKSADGSPTVTEEAKQYPLQFYYFVTKTDENYDEYMAMVKDFEKKYDGQITFVIKDIDEDPSARDNYSVDAFGTPMLIIVNDEGGFTAMEGKCDDENKIEGYIQKTLENRKYPNATRMPSGSASSDSKNK